METTIELIGYSSDSQESCSRGWVCGYVRIPLAHPILIKDVLREGGWTPQIPDFSQEITFWNKDKEALTIGFDTAHRWNNSTHDKNWVLNKARELKKYVDSFTMADAKKLAEAHIKAEEQRLKRFL